MDPTRLDAKQEIGREAGRESPRRTSFDAATSTRMVRLERENIDYKEQVGRLEAENNGYRGQVETLTRQVEQLKEQLRKAQEDPGAVPLKPESSTRSRSLSRLRRSFRHESDGGIEEEEPIKNLREELRRDFEKLRHDIGEDVSTKTFEKVAEVLEKARQPRDTEESAVEHAVADIRRRTMWQHVRALNRWNDTTGNTIYSFASMVITFAGFYYLFHSPQSSSASSASPPS